MTSDDCPHGTIVRKELRGDMLNAILDAEFIGGWYCTECGQRFAPINSDQEIVRRSQGERK